MSNRRMRWSRFNWRLLAVFVATWIVNVAYATGTGAGSAHVQDEQHRRERLNKLLPKPRPTSESQKEYCGMRPNHLGKKQFYSNAIRGRVIDVASKKPITGATVLAQWGTKMQYGGQHLGEFGALVHAIEVVTDEAGEYELPAWGPRSVVFNQQIEVAWWQSYPDTRIDANPEITVFHEDYNTMRRNMDDKRIPFRRLFAGWHADSDYNGKTLELYPLSHVQRPTMNHMWDVAKDMAAILYGIGPIEPCAWVRFKNSIRFVMPMTLKGWSNVSADENKEGFVASELKCDEFRSSLGCPSLRSFLLENAK
ncbi:MAG: carboxypeptidase regulatory-like domain-containing protein [Betaproteobacteria bacterium]|nr:carboxypeptidase regulatory-like domain-containing protein [Betaproteobacteria bacterium]